VHDNQQKDPQIKHENQLIRHPAKSSPIHFSRWLGISQQRTTASLIPSLNSCYIFKLLVSRLVFCSSSQQSAHTLEPPYFPFLSFLVSCTYCKPRKIFPFTAFSFCLTLVNDTLPYWLGYKYTILLCFGLSNQKKFPSNLHFTFLIMNRFWSSRNLTLTWTHNLT
jgi:hypothetical protein